MLTKNGPRTTLGYDTHVVLLLCVVFFAASISLVRWVRVFDIGFSFVLLWCWVLTFDFDSGLVKNDRG